MLPALLPLLAPVIDRLVGMIPDPNERERQKTELLNEIQRAATEQNAGQVEINKIEAACNSLFVAGWRPFIGWVCGLALAWEFFFSKIVAWALSIWSPGTPLPNVASDNLMELTFALLGLAGLRTYEKFKGVSGR